MVNYVNRHNIQNDLADADTSPKTYHSLFIRSYSSPLKRVVLRTS